MHKLPLTLLALFALLLMAQPALADVMAARVEGAISPASAEFIIKAIDRAEAANSDALVMELDTPGGLDTSMREIIKRMLASRVPIAVYVSPGGSRAASAGAFIMMAAHIAAMAPQTNIGAAHPVNIGKELDKTMSEKVGNDAAAFIKSLAGQRGRNAAWAQDAVLKSISSSEQEALKLGVIDLVAPDMPALLDAIDGRTVKMASGDRVLHTRDAKIVRIDMSMRDKILRAITDPNIAYILMMLGFYGLFFELTNPGAIFPGVLGAICLILAFYSFQSLTVNYAGVMLIVLAVILFILETQLISHGVLAIGAVISLSLGSIMLFEGSYMNVSYSIIVPALLVTILFFGATVWLAVRSMGRKPVTGAESLIEKEGRAASDITPEGGFVTMHGEKWSATSRELIEKDSRVTVEAVEGIRLKVKKSDQEAT